MAKKRLEGVGAFSGTRKIVPANPPPSKPLYTNSISDKSTGKKSNAANVAAKPHKTQAK